jgi:SAM-dependent methyltransferase
MYSVFTTQKPWATFARTHLTRIFSEKKHIIDIGGGLRVVKEKNNRYNKEQEWLRPLIAKVDYKVLDPVATYHPDIVGDIHHLPFADNSIDAYICIAVLEHVEDPALGVREMYRTLKKGGYAYIYVPFLYYYHPMKGYYGDFWRFTEDGLKHICRDFSHIEMVNVRGAIETLIKLSPFGRFTWMCTVGYYLDCIAGKVGSHQTSGYNVFLQK